MYRVAYFPYPRPSDLPVYRDEKLLYPGLLALQEPVSQTVFLYRLETLYEGDFPTDYTIYNYAGGPLESEMRINISALGPAEERGDGEPMYQFEAYSRFEDRAGKLISQGLLTRTGEIRWDEQDPGHWLHPHVKTLIEYLAQAPAKAPETIEEGQVITWDLPQLLSDELTINEHNFERHLPHWFAVEHSEDCTWYTEQVVQHTDDEEPLPPLNRLVQVFHPDTVSDRPAHPGELAPSSGYTAKVKGAGADVLKWGRNLTPTVWAREADAGLLPGFSGENLPGAIRDLVEQGEIIYPDDRIDQARG
ncbi:hypothetical protein [Rothia nasimurium]|uniref:hypothetical protein n=1 Tax=Rothia nasimurium TaxID=85336 RepID=UPI001F3DC63F|nr:hypothetical protein [Rothia nasimurium]